MVPQLTQGDLRHKDTVIFWLAIALVTVSVAFLATIISLAIRCVIRRHARYQKVDRPDDRESRLAKIPHSLWGPKNSRKLEDRVEQEELQREYMIRKSYASRSSIRSSSQLSHYSSDMDMESTAVLAPDASDASRKTNSKDFKTKHHEEKHRSPELRSGIVPPLAVEVDLGVRDVRMQEDPSPIPRQGLFALPSRTSMTTRYNVKYQGH